MRWFGLVFALFFFFIVFLSLLLCAALCRRSEEKRTKQKNLLLRRPRKHFLIYFYDFFFLSLLLFDVVEYFFFSFPLLELAALSRSRQHRPSHSSAQSDNGKAEFWFLFGKLKILHVCLGFGIRLFEFIAVELRRMKDGKKDIFSSSGDH